NHVAALIVGYKEPSDLIGLPWMDFVPFRTDEEWEKNVPLWDPDTDVSYVKEMKLLRDGTPVIVEVRVSKIFWDGEPVLISYVRDISEQKKYESKLNALHTYGSKLNVAETYEDIGRITLNAVKETFGHDYCDFNIVEDDNLVPNFIGDNFLENNLVLHVDGPGIIVRAYNTKETQIVHDTRKDPDYVFGRGPAQWLSELAVPVLMQDEVVAVINIESKELGAFNESDRKLVETLGIHVSAAFNRILTQAVNAEIREIVQKQEIRAEQAQVLDRMKENFISKAVHELRTPLTILRGYCDLLNDEEMMEDKQTRDNLISAAQRNLDRLESLVDKLLDKEQLTDGHLRLNCQVGDFRPVLDTIEGDASILLRPKGQTLSIITAGEFTPFSFDSERITQVVFNLVMNASKFSVYNSEIRVKAEDLGSELFLSVSDNGIGIREEDIERVFEPFSGINDGLRYPGIGVSLSVCKGIIELHGGRIWCESKGLDNGSTIKFILPKETS
ncbi:MAG: PAS domain-containing sensor histidine kinase, partial [Candidatus Bathyarchaeota archaeon]|nr:PAS domain-containing sensor histidine kinase [Candidatus Bathyarchaeota archaeon]